MKILAQESSSPEEMAKNAKGAAPAFLASRPKKRRALLRPQERAFRPRGGEERLRPHPILAAAKAPELCPLDPKGKPREGRMGYDINDSRMSQGTRKLFSHIERSALWRSLLDWRARPQEKNAVR